MVKPNFAAGGHCIAEDPAFIRGKAITPMLDAAFHWQERMPEMMAHASRLLSAFKV